MLVSSIDFCLSEPSNSRCRRVVITGGGHKDRAHKATLVWRNVGLNSMCVAIFSEHYEKFDTPKRVVSCVCFCACVSCVCVCARVCACVWASGCAVASVLCLCAWTGFTEDKGKRKRETSPHTVSAHVAKTHLCEPMSLFASIWRVCSTCRASASSGSLFFYRVRTRLPRCFLLAAFASETTVLAGEQFGAKTMFFGRRKGPEDKNPTGQQ